MNAEYSPQVMNVQRMLLALAALGLVGFTSTASAQEGTPRAKKPPAKTAPAKTAPAKTAPAKAAPAKAAPAKAAPAPSATPGSKLAPGAPLSGWDAAATAAPAPSVNPATIVALVPYRGLLGVKVGDMTPEKRVSAGAPPGAGLLVSEVLPNTVASVAGVKKNDVVIDVGGAPIRGVRDVRDALGQMHLGDLLTVQVIRDGKPKTLFATLAPPAKNVAGTPSTTSPPAVATLDGNLRFIGADQELVVERHEQRVQRAKRRILLDRQRHRPQHSKKRLRLRR